MAKSVNLNVGGQLYTTSESNLTHYKNSKLARIFNGQEKKRDDKGNIFIDGDADLFKYVLHFLRRSVLNLPSDFKEFSRLEEEAKYYNIPKLVEEISKRRLGTIETFMEVEYDLSIKKWEFSVHRGFLERIPVLQEHYKKFNQGPGSTDSSKKTETLLAFGNPSIDKIVLFSEISQLGFKLAVKSSSVVDKTRIDSWTFTRPIGSMALF